MDRWEDKPHEVVHQSVTNIPSYEVKDQQGNPCILHCNQLLLIVSEAGVPLCMGVCLTMSSCYRVMFIFSPGGNVYMLAASGAFGMVGWSNG